MCDCYYHECEVEDCEHRVPVHIADFNFERDCFKVWCHRHVLLAEEGAILFTLLKADSYRPEDYPAGWKCAIKGPAVGISLGNSPNLGGTFMEREIRKDF